MSTRLFLNVSFDWIKNTLDSKCRRYSFSLNISCSVICCALASLIPLVTRSFHADRVVAISLIICYIVALILSLLTGLEILWPPVRDESSWIINMNNKIKNFTISGSTYKKAWVWVRVTSESCFRKIGESDKSDMAWFGKNVASDILIELQSLKLFSAS